MFEINKFYADLLMRNAIKDNLIKGIIINRYKEIDDVIFKNMPRWAQIVGRSDLPFKIKSFLLRRKAKEFNVIHYQSADPLDLKKTIVKHKNKIIAEFSYQNTLTFRR